MSAAEHALRQALVAVALVVLFVVGRRYGIGVPALLPISLRLVPDSWPTQ